MDGQSTQFLPPNPTHDGPTVVARTLLHEDSAGRQLFAVLQAPDGPQGEVRCSCGNFKMRGHCDHVMDYEVMQDEPGDVSMDDRGNLICTCDVFRFSGWCKHVQIEYDQNEAVMAFVGSGWGW